MRPAAHLTAAAMGGAAIVILAIIFGCAEPVEGQPAATPDSKLEHAGAPAPGPAPAGGNACTKDGDCQGDQVCRDGVCRTPR